MTERIHSTTSTRRTHPLRRGGLAAFALLILAANPLAAAVATYEMPNILAIFGDDIGWFNLSIYNHGIMGYQTPNLDRIGKEGIVFTDAYAEQSCTAGRAAFLTGQHGLRTGMIKVGLPGVRFGLSHDDPTIPEILKYNYGYATGQFGKNHLGDTNDTLPTTHGFDQFFGNLYHLNAEEEPENPDYWSDQDPLPDGYQWLRDMEPRGVMYSYAADVTEPSAPPAGTCSDEDDNNPSKGQCIIDTGKLTSERMKGIDGAFAREAIRFMEEARTGTGIYSTAKPFFTWYAASRMHIWTHLKKQNVAITDAGAGNFDSKRYTGIMPDLWDGTNDGGAKADLYNEAYESDYYAEGKTGQGIHPDGMVEHDFYVGELLRYLDVAGIANNTIVMYTSDNGAETFSWPDGGTTPFRSEKNTNWEGAYRVPLLVRWPAKIPSGVLSNEIVALQDWFPTLVNLVDGASNSFTVEQVDLGGDIKGRLINGLALNDKTYKVHLDGYDMMPYFECLENSGTTNSCKSSWPREEFFYTNDDGLLVGMRLNDWKVVFYEQRAEGFDVWQDPFTRLRLPKIFNLRRDPFEKADYESSQYARWRLDRTFILTPAQVKVYEFLGTFNKFPPRQTPPSFSIDIGIDDIVEKCGTTDPTVNGDGTCYPELDLSGDHIETVPQPGQRSKRKPLRLPGFGG